jgi:hypothetical protein
MTLLRPNFRTESSAQNAGNGISGVQISKNFRGGHAPGPPSYARPRIMIRSELMLDPPLWIDINGFLAIYEIQAGGPLICLEIDLITCVRSFQHDSETERPENIVRLASYFRWFQTNERSQRLWGWLCDICAALQCFRVWATVSKHNSYVLVWESEG